jgi:hypothetical protein
LQVEEFVQDVVQDVLLKDKAASSLLDERDLRYTKINVFRFKQSLDDSTLLFWRPWAMNKFNEIEWPFIFFLKLAEGRLLANKDLGASV